MSTTDMTIDEVKRVLLEAVATEAGVPAAELATDRPFMRTVAAGRRPGVRLPPVRRGP
jgi:hypothetical protein